MTTTTMIATTSTRIRGGGNKNLVYELLLSATAIQNRRKKVEPHWLKGKPITVICIFFAAHVSNLSINPTKNSSERGRKI